MCRQKYEKNHNDATKLSEKRACFYSSAELKGDFSMFPSSPLRIISVSSPCLLRTYSL